MSNFAPEAIRTLERASERDIFIGGAELAGRALESDLADECHLFLNPVLVGGGKPAFSHAQRCSVSVTTEATPRPAVDHSAPLVVIETAAQNR